MEAVAGHLFNTSFSSHGRPTAPSKPVARPGSPEPEVFAGLEPLRTPTRGARRRMELLSDSRLDAEQAMANRVILEIHELRNVRNMHRSAKFESLDELAKALDLSRRYFSNDFANPELNYAIRMLLVQRLFPTLFMRHPQVVEALEAPRPSPRTEESIGKLIRRRYELATLRQQLRNNSLMNGRLQELTGPVVMLPQFPAGSADAPLREALPEHFQSVEDAVASLASTLAGCAQAERSPILQQAILRGDALTSPALRHRFLEKFSDAFHLMFEPSHWQALKASALRTHERSLLHLSQRFKNAEALRQRLKASPFPEIAE